MRQRLQQSRIDELLTQARDAIEQLVAARDAVEALTARTGYRQAVNRLAELDPDIARRLTGRQPAGRVPPLGCSDLTVEA